jgi:hypothetical protein
LNLINLNLTAGPCRGILLYFKKESARLGLCLAQKGETAAPKNGIRFSLSSPRPGNASSNTEGGVGVCLQGILRDSVGAGLRWICLDPIFVCASTGWILPIYISLHQ